MPALQHEELRDGGVHACARERRTRKSHGHVRVGMEVLGMEVVGMEVRGDGRAWGWACVGARSGSGDGERMPRLGWL